MFMYRAISHKKLIVYKPILFSFWKWHQKWWKLNMGGSLQDKRQSGTDANELIEISFKHYAKQTNNDIPSTVSSFFWHSIHSLFLSVLFFVLEVSRLKPFLFPKCMCCLIWIDLHPSLHVITIINMPVIAYLALKATKDELR